MDPLELAEQWDMTVSAVPRQRRRELMRRWRETFARAVKVRTGRWVYHGYDWHAFRWEFCPSKEGGQALELYAQQDTELVHILPQDEHEVAFDGWTKLRVDFSNCGQDIYVVPADFSWTMAFTHEQPGIGPFFTFAAWCTGLAE